MNFLVGLRLGYLTAIIEGEGTIDIRRNRVKYIADYIKRHYAYYYDYSGYTYAPYIVIANNSVELLEAVKDMIGEGRIVPVKRNNIKWKDSYYFRLTKRELVLILLRELLPYFMSDTKRRLCELIIEFCESRTSRFNEVRRQGGGGHPPYNTREIEIWKEVKELNKKGKKAY